jgi:hypothetical protein
MYTRLTGTGFQNETYWCTGTAVSILLGGVSETTPSSPAVLRPALCCVTWRTLTNVFDQDRSIGSARTGRAPSPAPTSP